MVEHSPTNLARQEKATTRFLRILLNEEIETKSSVTNNPDQNTITCVVTTNNPDQNTITCRVTANNPDQNVITCTVTTNNPYQNTVTCRVTTNNPDQNTITCMVTTNTISRFGLVVSCSAADTEDGSSLVPIRHLGPLRKWLVTSQRFSPPNVVVYEHSLVTSSSQNDTLYWIAPLPI